MARSLILLILALFALGPTIANAASVKLHGDTVYVSGPIEFDDLSLAEYLFHFGPQVRTVSLDSPGGNIAVAQYAAKIISFRGLDTRTERGKECASACVLLLLAGKHRSVDQTAGIGVHTAFVDEQSEFVKKLRKLRRKGIGKNLQQNATPEEIAGEVKALSPDIDPASRRSAEKRRMGPREKSIGSRNLSCASSASV